MKQIKISEIATSRLVKNEDLNHHKTLYAGRGVEWLVEAGFITAAKLVDPKLLRCVHFSEMNFSAPIFIGDILDFKSKVIKLGRSSITTYVKMLVNDKICGEGFLTFVKVVNEKSEPHNLELILETEEDILLNEKCKKL